MQTKFSELTDYQWEVIKKYFCAHRPRIHALRTIVNAILWVTRGGNQWRNLESKYPPWESVYYYFNQWRKNGLLDQVLSDLVRRERNRQGTDPEPSTLAVDSQSVKGSNFLDSQTTGLDGGKKINGRKRHIAVDKFGLPLAIKVTPANVHDGEAGIELLPQIEANTQRIKLIRADKSYGGTFKEIVTTYYKWEVETSQKPPSEKGFIPQEGRWQVERTFGWLNNFRRLTRDYEKIPQSHATFMKIAFITIILNRLQP